MMGQQLDGDNWCANPACHIPKQVGSEYCYTCETKLREELMNASRVALVVKSIVQTYENDPVAVRALIGHTASEADLKEVLDMLKSFRRHMSSVAEDTVRERAAL